jgi:hypothetical protein
VVCVGYVLHARPAACVHVGMRFGWCPESLGMSGLLSYAACMQRAGSAAEMAVPDSVLVCGVMGGVSVSTCSVLMVGTWHVLHSFV